MMTPRVLCSAVGQTQAPTRRSVRLPQGTPEASSFSAVSALFRAPDRSVVQEPGVLECEKEEEEMKTEYEQEQIGVSR